MALLGVLDLCVLSELREWMWVCWVCDFLEV